ncbi:MAG: ribosome silencing factor [Chloroflexi bacterium]|nr:ribosome silencing factor [Chloroflexota bacterium]MDA1226456.1 ribosome silencing factor [Chloroflexota bacterium]
MVEKTVLQSLDYAHIAVEYASDKLASDVLLLDIHEVSDFCDYFVIISTDSTRQLNSLAEDLEHELERRGSFKHHREGTPQSGWMLLDFGDVIVHIFGPEMREFYDLESVWHDATEIVRLQ